MPSPARALKVADDGPDIREMIADWKIHIGQKSANTIKIYIRSAEKLAAFLEEFELPTGVAGISPTNLRLFMNGLKGSEATRSQIYRSLQQFFKFLMAEEEIQTDPMLKVEAPSQKPVPVPVMATDDLRALVAACKGGDLESRRDLAIVRLLIDTGMRVGELESMTVDCVELDRGLITITGKTGTRQLLLEQPTLEALRRYLRIRGKHRNANRPELWVALKGNRTGVLTYWGIEAMIKRRAEQAGIAGRVNPHRFRHTYAHRWLANGGQEHDLMHNAGWKSPSMIARYGASAAQERARAAAARAGLADQI